jgi:NitT/TauT family transport system substrate-binding protein
MLMVRGHPRAIWAALVGPLLLVSAVACAPTPSGPSPTAPLAAAPTPTAAPTAAPAGSTSKITVVNTAVTGAFGGFWTAIDAGYFQDEGIEVQITHVDSTSRSIPVLLAGEAQFSSLDGQTIIEADLKGADLRAVAAATNRFVFFVMADPSIKAPADLKGKRLGITTPGSSTDTAARKALALWNLEPNTDLALVPLASGPNILTGLTAKQIDAGVLGPPTSTRARMAGYQEMVNLAKDGPEYPSVTFGTTQKYLHQNPQAALGFVRAYSRGLHRFKTDKPFALQVLGKYLELNDQAVLEDTWAVFSPVFEDIPYVNPRGVQNAIDSVAQTVPEAVGATPDRFVESSFVSQLDEGGFYRQLLGS